MVQRHSQGRRTNDERRRRNICNSHGISLPLSPAAAADCLSSLPEKMGTGKSAIWTGRRDGGKEGKQQALAGAGGRGLLRFYPAPSLVEEETCNLNITLESKVPPNFLCESLCNFSGRIMLLRGGIQWRANSAHVSTMVYYATPSRGIRENTSP